MHSQSYIKIAQKTKTEELRIQIHASREIRTGCKHPRPYLLASKLREFSRVLSMGGFNLRFPNGGSAKGIPVDDGYRNMQEISNRIRQETVQHV